MDFIITKEDGGKKSKIGSVDGGNDSICLEENAEVFVDADESEYDWRNIYTELEQKEIEINVPFSVKYKYHTRRIPYRSRVMEMKLNLHRGQRKLFLSELYFLVHWGHLADLVVYAGAAPGSHTSYLVELFPEHKFHLYDPRDFDPRLYKYDAVEVHQEYFTDDVARKYAGKNVLFVCDIRTGSSNEEGGAAAFEKEVIANMRQQERWHKIMSPAVSMLKFRLPYVYDPSTPKKFTYMDGKIILQVWAPRTSTETRLIVPKKPKNKEYDFEEYEQRMFRFNLITRQWTYYDHPIELEGLDHCFDCRAEVFMLTEYVEWSAKRNGEDLTRQQINSRVRLMIAKITKRLGQPLYSPPHGVLPKVPMKKKYMFLNRKYRKTYHEKCARKLKWKKGLAVTKRKHGGSTQLLYPSSTRGDIFKTLIESSEFNRLKAIIKKVLKRPVLVTMLNKPDHVVLSKLLKIFPEYSEADEEKYLHIKDNIRQVEVRRLLKNKVDIIRKYKPLTKKSRTLKYLDFGAGNCRITEAIRKELKFSTAEAIDVEGWYGDSSKKDVNTYDYPSVNFQYYNGKDIPFDDETFSVITCFQVLHHVVGEDTSVEGTLKTLDYVMNEFLRVLAIGGILIVREQDCYDSNIAKCIDVEHALWGSKEIGVDNFLNTYKANYFSKEFLEKKLMSIGFEKVQTPIVIKNGATMEKNPSNSYYHLYRKI